MRALAWEFPNNPSLASVDTQFLLGPNLMVIPMLEPNASTVKDIFPGSRIQQNLLVRLVHLNPHPRVHQARRKHHHPHTTGPYPPLSPRRARPTLQQPALSTRAARQTSWSLLVAPDNPRTAHGDLYLHDGESLHPLETKHVTFRAGESTLTAKGSGDRTESNPLANVTVWGCTGRR